MQSNFTTKRLFLSSLKVDKHDFILALVNSPGWLRFIGDRNIHSSNDAKEYISKIIQNPNLKYWAVELLNSQIPIGIISFIKRDYLEFPDIGFAFLPEYEKSGYAFEATSVILDYLIRDCITEHLLATTMPDNVGSIRLLNKLGFMPEREIEINQEKLLVYRLA
jgi:[ribosomal protein S5]-alanine N-acetyltransferase